MRATAKKTKPKTKAAPSCRAKTSASNKRRSAPLPDAQREIVKLPPVDEAPVDALPLNQPTTAISDELVIRYEPLTDLLRAPRNPKNHNLDQIESSMKRHGFVAPIIKNQATGRIVAGHGRLDTLLASKSKGEPAPKRVRVVDGEWFVPVVHGIAWESDAEAEAYLIADNQLTMMGGWNEPELIPMLNDLAITERGLMGTGFDREDLDAMIADLADRTASKENDAAMLKKLRVTIPEPETIVQTGEVYRLCGRHVLVIGDVIREVQLWKKYLDDIDWLLVYPGPFAGISQAALVHRLLLIQPNVTIAGHLLDQVKRVHGEESVETFEMLTA